MVPDIDMLGQTRSWEIPGGDAGNHEVEARFIGYGTSRADYHSRHRANAHAEVGVKCQACRWLEIRVYDDGNQFTVSYLGRSDVPYEVTREWFMVTDTEDSLVDLLSGEGRDGRFFSKPARMAIECARQYAPDVFEAYLEHDGHPNNRHVA